MINLMLKKEGSMKKKSTQKTKLIVIICTMFFLFVFGLPLQSQAVLCYEDKDGDTYGAGVGVDRKKCNKGWSATSDDCDDGDPNNYPTNTEVCDGQDNNCDTGIDEGFSLGEGCDGVGECGAGVLECADANSTRCSTDTGGSADGSTSEICDGLDNDCDGIADGSENITQSCGFTDVGACSLGTETCDDTGSWVGCDAVEPATEICDDGIDNDCDGDTDTADTDCAGTQRAALMALYNSTDGDNWTINTGWDVEGPDECLWYGVTCEAGNVTKIELINNNLDGPIPDAIVNLSLLFHLDLRNNSLTGTIPSAIGNLALTYLDLSQNNLEGSIPTGFGDLFDTLQYLHLNNNRLGGPIPPAIWDFTGLVRLALHNQDEPGGFTGTIPSTIGNLLNLEFLNLAGNSLGGEILSYIVDLEYLEEVYLYDNQFTGTIPTQIGNLAQLRDLLLGLNQFTGNIPPELGSLSNLERLRLHHNQFTGNLPDELGNLGNLGAGLYYFDIEINQLWGSIPTTFSNLTALETFNVTGNCLVDFEPVQFPLNDVPNLIGAD
jgi:Leucine-rich repeat (LRR) protein